VSDKAQSADAPSGFRPTLRLSPGEVDRAAALIAAGGLVAFPTETVYGLGADATDPRAVAALYAAKERPAFNPLIAHVASLSEARALALFGADAERLAAAFWPGPLTIVVPAAEDCPVCDLARAGLSTIALRAPDHPVAQALITAAGRPIVAPSANRSGRVSPTSADHVLADLDGRIDAVIDGGSTRVGVESTIIACLGGEVRLLRPGGAPRETIEAVLGKRLAGDAEDAARPLAPGALASHYAPRARVRLDATDIRPGEAALAFGEALADPAGAAAHETLSATGDLVEAAARLFACLRKLDASGAATIAVAPIPAHGLGEAIRDRLARAAAPRP
jgi:L-threonylcarbamoyladenylate synthase